MAKISLTFAEPLSSSLLSAVNNYGKSNFKWEALFRSVGLLILDKPLPLQGHPSTVFCKISVRISKYRLKFSTAPERLKISG